ncbi:MAG: DegT/DnrJ/EryC1/StrS aminotransferase [Myxococcales bacterium]|nr:DegT/DnrJ/EryC1/StrS aminotransferase [Myxococcales bacterium]
MSVPFFDMAAEIASVRTEIDAAIARVLDSGVLIGGEEVAAFERELAVAVGVTHAVGMSSGTDALHVLAMALDISAGDEVVTTPLTFFATAGAFARLGARIVFADVDDSTLTLDPIAAQSVCSSRSRAIVPVHLFGHPADLPAVSCPIIEDAAQSIGGGALRGLAAAFSFFPTKNLGAIGDAGAVVTNDAMLADRVALLRTQGARPKYHHLAIGGNFRIDSLQAAVLRAKLAHLGQRTSARRARAERYHKIFEAAHVPSELRLPVPHPAHMYHQFVIRAPRRDELRRQLASHGIATEVYYPEPLHLQPCLEQLGYRRGSFPNAERACNEVLALPIQPSLSEDTQVQVVEMIAGFFR